MPPPVTVSILLSVLVLASACHPVDQGDRHRRYSQRIRRSIERSTGEPASALQLPDPLDYAAIPQDPRNLLTAEKVALGRALFHEAGLSIATLDPARRGSVSCASCHAAGAGFRAGRIQGLGEGATKSDELGEARLIDPTADLRQVDAQGIRTPSVLAVAYQDVLHWNGQMGAAAPNEGTESNWTPGTPKAVNELGYAGVESQAIAGLGIHRMAVSEALIDSLGYRAAFDGAFGSLPPDRRFSAEAAGLAIAAYERTLLPTASPWQEWLRGDDDALTMTQLRGAGLFFGAAGCGGCHGGPALSDGDFHILGMADLYAAEEPTVRASADMGVNLGRAGFTHRDVDLYAFKTPQLYNLADASHYGHGGSFDDLASIVRYKVEGATEHPRVGPQHLDPEHGTSPLSETELGALVAFLSEGLRDPDLDRYVPTADAMRRDEALALER